MKKQLRIEGIYDKRTITYLKSFGIKNYCFDFSPKSFNFIQEYVFLEQIINLLDSNDNIFLHFSRSNDPMVSKLIDDLLKLNISLQKIYFDFDEWASADDAVAFQYNYLLNFSNLSDPYKYIGTNFRGFIFNFNFFQDLQQNKLLNNFAVNFYTRYESKLLDSSLMIMQSDWNHNLFASLFDIFEFNIISLPINSKIEVCYRNVDLKKLESEMKIIKSNNYSLKELV